MLGQFEFAFRASHFIRIQIFQIEYNTDSVEPVENLVAEAHLEQGELNVLHHHL